MTKADTLKKAADADPRLFVAAVDKALTVLRAFEDAPGALSLSEVAERTGLGKSAAQRFLYTLKALGYLRQHPATKRYTLAPSVLNFAYAYLRSDNFVEKSFPYLLDASKRTDETINLTELDGTEVIYVSRFPSRNIISVDIVLGARLPAFCTAPGRAILSRLPPDEAAALIGRSKLEPRTAYTETDPGKLIAKLDEARTAGYAVSDQESFLGDISIAAPVLDRTGHVVAATNIAVSTSRWTVEQVERQLAPVIVETARAISKALGYRGG